jgi:hypothetical protein
VSLCFACHVTTAPQAVRLVDFLREAAVPLHARDALPLLLWPHGAVAAVYPAWAAAPLHAPPQPAGDAAGADAGAGAAQAGELVSVRVTVRLP